MGRAVQDISEFITAARTIAGAALAVSGWSAWNSFKARSWQRDRDRERRVTRVSFDFVHSFQPVHTIDGLDVDLYDLMVLIRNDGESTEYVDAVFLEVLGEAQGRWGLRIFGNEGGGEHHELAPRSSQRVDVRLDDQAVEHFAQGFVAIAWLGSGERVASGVEHLVDPASAPG